MDRYKIYSCKDNIYEAEVFGNTIADAIEKIIYFYEHTELIDTDWNIYDTEDNLVVANGIIQ